MTEYLNFIQAQAADLGDAIEDVLDTLFSSHPEFAFWSGSHHPDAHHYGKFGLIKHTSEVIRLCFATKKITGVSVDDGELFLAALFHDTGKLFDYEPIDSTYLHWAPTSHKRLIHHISRSALIWHNCVDKHPEVNTRYHDNVLHAILSHHGQREWGSPVAPKSKVAWLVHLCDGISARMDDADRLDQIKNKG
jgi:3'-5' exoribonuclease